MTSTAVKTTFALERFAWSGPDCLEVSGWFHGVGEMPSDPPALRVTSGDTTHDLAVVPERLSAPPRDGRRWCAAFSSDAVPETFERAQLELGDELLVELPQPDPKRARRGRKRLRVHRVRPAKRAGAAPSSEQVAELAAALATQEHVRSLLAVRDQLQTELGRARADLEAERRGRRADAESFREGLAHLRAAAEDAIAAERSTVQGLERALGDAHDQLEDQTARLAALESVVSDARRQCSELGSARDQAMQLLNRLTELRDALAEDDRW